MSVQIKGVFVAFILLHSFDISIGSFLRFHNLMVFTDQLVQALFTDQLVQAAAEKAGRLPSEPDGSPRQVNPKHTKTNRQCGTISRPREA